MMNSDVTDWAMSFGQALEALAVGKRARRAGWNGKGMWIALTHGSVLDPAQPLHGAAEKLLGEDPRTIVIEPHIDMRTAQGTIQVGWLASQADMLAHDWEVFA